MSAKSSVVATFRTIFSVIPKDQRKRAFWVLVAMLLASLVQVVGVASVMPFLLVLTDPNLITANPALSRAYDGFGFETPQSFQIALGIMSFAILLLSAALRSIAFYAQHVFAQNQRVVLSARIMQGYLAQPYRFFVRSVQAELAKTLTQETSQFVDRALVPAATVVNASLQLATLLLLLVVLDPVVTLVMIVVLGSTYVAAYRLTRPHLTRHGEARLSADLDSIHAVWETLSGIKAIKLAGTEDTFLNRYRTPAQTVGRAMAMVALMQTLPRYVIEAVAFGCIVLLAMVLTVNSGPVGGSVLPMLALYAFAGYKMMPALQQIYNGLASIRFVAGNIQAISARLVELEQTPALLSVPAPLPVQETIVLDDVSYHHNSDEGRGIDGISLTLTAGQSLGLVGSSGAGKTTRIDVLLGLMTPDSGRLLVDGTPIDDSNRRSWQQSLGYVPQDIFLATRSVVENIAFGYEPDQIDRARVETCARIAQIHDTVTQDLPYGYDTQIGDRGLRLSGGQRQRLGIARALYGDPAVLVFDEATNALDPITEACVTQALTKHCAEKTRIVIAHRLSSVASCDLIAVMQEGRLIDLGSYDQLSARSEIFQALRRAETQVEPTP